VDHRECTRNWRYLAFYPGISIKKTLSQDSGSRDSRPKCESRLLDYEAELIYLWLYSPLLGLGRFFSFLILYTVGMTPWTGISPSQGRYLHIEQQKHRINADIHALSEIRTHDPRVQASEECSWLRPRDHCDRHEAELT
jgi:hypothetical protein